MSVNKRKAYIDINGNVSTSESFDEISRPLFPVGKTISQQNSNFVGVGFEVSMTDENVSGGETIQGVCFKSKNVTQSENDGEPYGESVTTNSYAYASAIYGNQWKSSPKLSYNLVHENRQGAFEDVGCGHVYNENENPQQVGPISAYYRTTESSQSVLVAVNCEQMNIIDNFYANVYVNMRGNIYKVVYDDGVTEMVDTSVSGEITHTFTGARIHSALIYTTSSFLMPKTFHNIPTLVGLRFSDYITMVMNSACSYSFSLSYVELGSNMKYLGARAFCGDTSLSAINLENVEEIRDYCFYGAFSLVEGDGFTLDISNGSLKNATVAAFMLTNLNEVVLPPTLETLGIACFRESTLKSFSISGSAPITTIPEYCFMECGGLRLFEVSLDGNNITKFDDNSFNSTSSLTSSFQTMKKLKYIGTSAFYGSSVETFTTLDTLLEIGSGAYYSSNIHTFTMSPSNKLQRINAKAFMSTSLSSFTRTKKLELVGESAFCYCTSLTDFMIPRTVWGLRKYAFYGSALSAIRFENGCVLLDVGDYAFSHCSSASLVNFGYDSCIQRIGEEAFSYDTGLTGMVTIPKSIIKIEDGAFYTCTSLRAVNFMARDENTAPAAPTMTGLHRSIDERAFVDCFNLRVVYLHQEEGAIPNLNCTWKLPVFQNANFPSYYADRCFYGADNNEDFMIHVRRGLKNKWGYGNGLLYYYTRNLIVDDLNN